MPKSSKQKGKSQPSAHIFGPSNYILMLVSVLLIVTGFVAMYLEGAFLGVISLNISPVVIMAGYALLIYAILRRSDDSEQATTEEA